MYEYICLWKSLQLPCSSPAAPATAAAAAVDKKNPLQEQADIKKEEKKTKPAPSGHSTNTAKHT